MAVRKKGKKQNARARFRAKGGRMHKRKAAKPAPPHQEELGNPFEVKFLPGFLLPHQAEQILILKRQQEKMWTWVLVLAIILFFVLSVMEISILLGWAQPHSERMAQIVEQADLMAIGVFAFEFAAQYRKAENKALFFKKNWLGILAILPMGLFFRAASVAEEIAFLRSLQMMIKAEKIQVALPGGSIIGASIVNIPLKMLSDALLAFQAWLAHFSVVTDFVELVASSIKRVFK